MNITDKKTEIITIRCTRNEKEMIERKSEQKQQCISGYMLDCSMAGLERRRIKDHERIILMVERQERLNSFIQGIRSSLGESEVLSTLMEFAKEENRLWG